MNLVKYGIAKAELSTKRCSSWLELFTDTLHEQDDSSKLALDLMEVVQERFSMIDAGEFQFGPTGWPLAWTYYADDRDAFLRQVRWFSSNHCAQFGRLLTPLVDGVRVKGPFYPRPEALRNAPRLVLLDGEGIGHSAKAASSISTRITRRFAEADLILIVDNAEQPMQAAPLELLRSIGSSGNADKMAIAFTHFDLVKGPNLGSHALKLEHVLNSVRDAIGSVKDAIGAPVAAALENRIESSHEIFDLRMGIEFAGLRKWGIRATSTQVSTIIENRNEATQTNPARFRPRGHLLAVHRRLQPRRSSRP